MSTLAPEQATGLPPHPLVAVPPGAIRATINQIAASRRAHIDAILAHWRSDHPSTSSPSSSTASPGPGGSSPHFAPQDIEGSYLEEASCK